MKRLHVVLASLLVFLSASHAVAQPTATYTQKGRYYLMYPDANGNAVRHTTEYNTDHKAKEDAVNLSFSCKCVVTINGPSVEVATKAPVEVVQPPAPTIKTVTYIWSAPSTREDGTSLPESEIKGYEFTYSDGTTSKTVPIVDKSVVVDLGVGTWKANVVAVDINDLKSVPSNSVEVVVK